VNFALSIACETIRGDVSKRAGKKCELDESGDLRTPCVSGNLRALRRTGIRQS
jgi:hypothetical protein